MTPSSIAINSHVEVTVKPPFPTLLETGRADAVDVADVEHEAAERVVFGAIERRDDRRRLGEVGTAALGARAEDPVADGVRRPSRRGARENGDGPGWETGASTSLHER